MKSTKELQQLIDNNKNLTITNNRLVKINAEAIQFTKENLRKQEKLLSHCGKIYKLLHSKINKTWEEHDCIEILYNLITRSETKENES